MNHISKTAAFTVMCLCSGLIVTGCMTTPSLKQGQQEIPEIVYPAPPAFPDEVKPAATEYDPEKKDYLVITSSPPDAQIFLDDRFAGTTPLELRIPDAGFYTLRCVKPGYKEVNETFYFLKNENSRHIILEKVTGTLEVITTLQEVQVIINNQIITEMPVLLPAGRYSARVVKFGYEPKTVQVTIRENEVTVVKADLDPTPCTITAISVSRTRVNPATKNTEGLLFVHFMVTGPGTGRIAVFDNQGKQVFAVPLNMFSLPHQVYGWDLKASDGSVCEDGDYRIVVSVSDTDSGKTSSADIYFTIDSSFFVSVRQSVQGVPGLLYGATPDILPPFSMQLDTNIFTELPVNTDLQIPVMIGYTAGIFDNFEVHGSAGTSASTAEDINISTSVAAKYRWLDIGDALKMQAGVFSRLTLYSAANTMLSGNPTGFSIGAPLSFSLGDFSIVIDPEGIFSMTPFPCSADVSLSQGYYFGVFAKAGLYFDNRIIRTGVSGSMFFTQDNDQFLPVYPIHAAYEITFLFPGSGFFLTGNIISQFTESDMQFVTGIRLGLFW
ncbi:MAG: PEGA domain-containing protein [Spirochaetales bacterium]|nr:PEGA domain-containing protein [Spirochaetales bacterium]